MTTSSPAIAIAVTPLWVGESFLIATDPTPGLSPADVEAGAIIGLRRPADDVPQQPWRCVDWGGNRRYAQEHLVREVALDGPEVVEALYLNHAGVNAWRKFVPGRLWFGTTEWHPEPQHLLQVWDLERGALRDYAIENIQQWRRQRVFR